MKILITGCGGFVAPYVIEALRNAFGSSVVILGTHHRAVRCPGVDEVRLVDVNDAAAVSKTVSDFHPDHFIHLAAVSQIPTAAADANAAWRTNVLGTLNCARAVLDFAGDASFIFASSGHVYGDSHERRTEESPVAPINEYGATKAAADIALGALATRGLRVIRMRSFNHTGPRQSEMFVVPSFAAQIARIEQGQPPVIHVGDLEAERDFLDVRDVADAYARTVLKAKDIPAGTVLNVCSGQPVKIRTMLDGLVALSHKPIAIEIDPARLRKLDLSISYGNPTRCRQMLDWKPQYTLQRTLSDVLEFQRSAVSFLQPGQGIAEAQ
ncbi:GDP-mannose 4,6-dehydratase [Mesorhizobium sp.]|uniref:GDP-mannose 4,6-dehydratase n=1 Tax=Mesorhizobium sp. TaxID=1871066 RepID=UPI0025F26DF3|nr:GDP-mannose 4,6-dehydratase [Mesorhizobium sp.]